MSKEKDLRLSSVLVDWYNVHKRDLPWRDTTDPYLIWLSEVILQQTRVDQGYAYFNKFVDHFPTVDLLAAVDESEVLKLWQGLGYYSRARNLHAAAKMIVESYDGKFPESYNNVLALKGVGEYTAAAIVSFAYNQPYAVVDGNVFRVLSRIFAIEEPVNTTKGKKIFTSLAQELLDEDNPGVHNQAIMEFGALQCVPVSPRCVVCPVQDMCLSFAKGLVNKYPVKEKKQKIRHRYFYYFDFRYGDYMYLHKREEKDIWQNLYELPLVESDKDLDLKELIKEDSFKSLIDFSGEVYIKPITQIKHVLSHQIIHANFFQIVLEHNGVGSKFFKIKVSEVDNYPVSRLVHKYLELM